VAGRAGKALAGTLTALVVLVVGADIATRLVVQNTLEGRLQDELALSAAPNVSIHGFPFLFHLARQRFPSADIEARRVSAEGLTFRLVRLEVEDLRFSTGGGLIRARRGTGRAELTDRAVSELLAAEGAPLTVRFGAGSASVSADAGGQEVSAAGRLRLRDGVLVFRPEDAPQGILGSAFAFEVRLPEVIEGVSYRSLELQDGVALLAVALDSSVLRVRV
jgi:hypothetical protein